MKDKKWIISSLRYVKKIWWIYIPALLLFSAQNLFVTASVSLLQKKAVDFLGGGAPKEKWKEVLFVLAVYIMLLLFLLLFAALIDYVNMYIGNTLKKELLGAYLVPQNGGKEENIGDMSVRLISDCGNIAAFLSYELGMFLMPLLQFAGCAFILWRYHWMLGLGAVVCSVFPLLYNRMILKGAKETSRRMQENGGDFIDRLGASMTMAETIKTYGLEKEEQEKSNAVIMLGKKLRLKWLYYEAGRLSVSNVCHFLYVSAAVALGVYLYQKGTLPLSVITVIPLLASGVLAGIVDFCGVSFDMQPMMVSMGRVFTVIDESRKAEAANQSLPEKTAGEQKKAAVEMEKVSFFYENGSGISDISLTVQPYTFLAVKGEIGSGKSTMMKVLLGMERETAGSISVFGEKKEALPPEKWFEKFTYVEQEQKLFWATIEENILLGEERDEERLQMVLALTGLSGLLRRLPEGLQTMVEEQGANFSGGERQLICFAHALYSHAPIMILDEFSSAFDSKTDDAAIAALQKVTGDAASAIRKTAIVISHKQNYIDAADTVYTMC